MAAVWAGTNERTGKQVALKVISRSLATTRVAQDLFHREVLAASLVNHPNVVTIFDVIEHAGMACIVMELLEGEPLGSYIARKGFLSVSEATGLLLPAMRGVAAANAQGVIHRDLKPPNIFICMEPDGRIVTTKVLDFGISVMVERALDSSAGPTLAMGTPAYMSPEHILGVPDIDGRADVYGFGVLLYESLTGQMAFPGELGPGLFDWVLHEPAVPVTVARPDLPAGLVRIIEKAMAKDRDQRYSDVNLMLVALEDELMPSTSAPRLLTPQAGVPSLARARCPVRASCARAARFSTASRPGNTRGHESCSHSLWKRKAKTAFPRECPWVATVDQGPAGERRRPCQPQIAKRPRQMCELRRRRREILVAGISLLFAVGVACWAPGPRSRSASSW